MTPEEVTQTLLHAAKAGDLDAARAAIENGADVNFSDHSGNTPLHLAAENDHAGIAQLLIKKGAYINATDDGRRTPLNRAAANGHAEIVALLQDPTK